MFPPGAFPGAQKNLFKECLRQFYSKNVKFCERWSQFFPRIPNIFSSATSDPILTELLTWENRKWWRFYFGRNCWFNKRHKIPKSEGGTFSGTIYKDCQRLSQSLYWMIHFQNATCPPDPKVGCISWVFLLSTHPYIYPYISIHIAAEASPPIKPIN